MRLFQHANGENVIAYKSNECIEIFIAFAYFTLVICFTVFSIFYVFLFFLCCCCCVNIFFFFLYFSGVEDTSFVFDIFHFTLGVLHSSVGWCFLISYDKSPAYCNTPNTKYLRTLSCLWFSHS